MTHCHWNGRKTASQKIKASQSALFQRRNYILSKKNNRTVIETEIPLLKKKPAFVIIDTGTNGATHKTFRQILDNLLKLKH